MDTYKINGPSFHTGASVSVRPLVTAFFLPTATAGFAFCAPEHPFCTIPCFASIVFLIAANFCAGLTAGAFGFGTPFDGPPAFRCKLFAAG